jgi:catechol 2,3-dioxygenase-like lactoylglutathione lyase family enzyme
MIQHVTRVVSPAALEECVRFYGILGLRPIAAPAGIEGRAVWLGGTGPHLHLMLADDAEPERGHVAFVLENYDAVLGRLRADGHEIEPRREHWGSPRAYVRDPAGHLVEVMARAPGDVA